MTLLHCITTLLSLLSFCQSVTPPDWKLYFTADSLLDAARTIAANNPDHFTAHQCSDIPYYSLTSRHTAASDIHSAKLRLLLNFGEHGRELISPEVGLTLLRFFDRVNRDSERTSDGENDVSDEFVAFILRNTHITVVPLLNAWGRRQVELGNSCSRKNKNGIDLNRNWDFLFQKNTFLSIEETYAGSQPFSESESQCLRNVSLTVMPHVYVNVHSGIQELYYGWDHSAELIPNVREVSRLYEFVNNYHCSCRTGGAGKIGGYVVYGGSMDWLYTHCNTSYSLTYELYGNSGVSPHDCYAYFNPTDSETLLDIKYRFASSFLSLAYYLIREKFGLSFPYRLPSFLLNEMHMGSEKKNSGRLYYHSWKQHQSVFPLRYQSLIVSDRTGAIAAASDHGSGGGSASVSDSLRVLMLGDIHYNHHFTTEILHYFQLNQQSSQHQAIEFIIVPSLFPGVRASEGMYGSCWVNNEYVQRSAVDDWTGSVKSIRELCQTVKPHIVIELTIANPPATSSDADTDNDSQPSRSAKLFQLELLNGVDNDESTIALVRNTKHSRAFVAAIKQVLAKHLIVSTPPAQSVVAPLNAFAHLQLRFTGLFQSNPQRRMNNDRFPLDDYRRDVSSPTEINECDWQHENPSVELLKEWMPSMLTQLRAVFESLEALDPMLVKKHPLFHAQYQYSAVDATLAVPTLTLEQVAVKVKSPVHQFTIGSENAPLLTEASNDRTRSLIVWLGVLAMVVTCAAIVHTLVQRFQQHQRTLKAAIAV